MTQIINYACLGLVIIAALYYNVRWHKSSLKENGTFSKEEVINNAFGNIFFILWISYFGGKELNWEILLIVIAGMGATHLITAWKNLKSNNK